MNFLRNETRAAIEQYEAVYPDFLDQIKSGFIDALIWQDETLDNLAHLDLSYSANEQVNHVVRLFVFCCATDRKAMTEIVDHGFAETGHDLALQMLGHGVGFWEQDNTKSLDNCLSHLLDFKVIKPFYFFTSESTVNCNGDQILEFDFL